MKQLMKAEAYRLFYRFDNLGVVIIGSFLMLVFSVFLQMMISDNSGMILSGSVMERALQNSGFLIPIFVALMEAYVVGTYIQNKQVNYELMTGYSYEQIWIVKQSLVGGMITVVFGCVALASLKVENILKDTQCMEGSTYRMFLFLLVIFRLSFVAMLCIYCIRNLFFSVTSFLLAELFFIPNIVNMMQNVRIGKIAVYNLVSTYQVELIWTENIPKRMMIIVIIGMVVEMTCSYILAKLYTKWKGKSLYV